jgi:NTE family protein
MAKAGPRPGVGLCMSGGGFRAMLFHLGALWRLNEWGYLKRISRISSVSGGSITAGLLGARWKNLSFDATGVARAFPDEIVRPITEFAGTSIDKRSVIVGVFGPGSVSDRIVKAYDRALFRGATLQDFPSDEEGPRFVINASNVQSGVLWRFSKPYMRDYRVGEVKRPTVRIAVAVAASSAFPPFLSPVELRLKPSDFTPGTGTDLQRQPFTTNAILTDGGVYDNLGLETVWKACDTVLVSDGGGRMTAESSPKRDWARHSKRILDLIDSQVRSLRKRHLLQSLDAGERKGTYWGIWTNVANYHPLSPPCLPCPHDRTLALAGVATGLARLDTFTQERLINWGYAVCDAAMRRYVDSRLAGPLSFPYPSAAV